MRTIVGLASLVVVIGMAAPVHADPNDDTRGTIDGLFLASLEDVGLSFKDGPAAITAGKQSCEYMNEGKSKSEVAKGLSSSNPGLSTDDAAKFMTNAAKSYCPEHIADSAPAAKPTPAKAAQ